MLERAVNALEAKYGSMSQPDKHYVGALAVCLETQAIDMLTTATFCTRHEPGAELRDGTRALMEALGVWNGVLAADTIAFAAIIPAGYFLHKRMAKDASRFWQNIVPICYGAFALYELYIQFFNNMPMIF